MPSPTSLYPDLLLQVADLHAIFPDSSGGLHALEGVSFDVNTREFVSIIGPSASGKSTLLRIIGGLLEPTAGQVTFAGKPIDGPPEGVGLVFQHANLMPWRTVLENITLPLELKGVGNGSAMEQAQELVSLVGMNGFEAWLPRDLSGGMAQRVAIARSLVQDPEMLLLDEPFGALDALTRERMGDELLRIWAQKQKTILMVTHAIDEAIFLADRVLVLSPQPGTVKLDLPIKLPRPRDERTRYSADFMVLAKTLRQAIG